MAERVVSWLVWGMYTYALIGGVFSLCFVARGVQRVDLQSQGSRLGFRFLIFPGVASFWPLFLRRWLHANGEPPMEGNPHR